MPQDFRQQFFPVRGKTRQTVFRDSSYPLNKSNDPEFRQILVGLGPLQLQVFQRFDDCFGDKIIPVPFSVRRNDVPRGIMGAAKVDGVFIRLHELWPMCAHFEILRLKLPILPRIIDARLEAPGLLPTADVQKEF